MQRLIIVVVFLILASCGMPPNMPNPSSAPNSDNPYQIAQLPAWHLWDPVDPNQPNIMIADGDSYRVDPTWQVQSIDYRFVWNGLGTPGMYFDQIQRQNGMYQQRDGTSIATEDISAFLASLHHFYPIAGYATWTGWLDDYPAWNVSITGTNGAQLLIYTTSTGNIGHAPWILRYNGRLYAQYDARLEQPLAKLFISIPAKSDDIMRLSGDQSGFTQYHTAGTSRYRGIIHDAFLPFDVEFSAFSNTGISGTIALPMLHYPSYEQADVPQFSPSKVGLVDHNQSIACKLNQNKPYRFVCPIKNAQAGTEFRYKMQIDYTNQDAQTHAITGTLRGMWDTQYDYDLQPIAPELVASLLTYPTITDLLNDHVLIEAEYTAEFPQDANALAGTRTGILRFLGQTNLNNQPVRYTINTPFRVYDGKINYFALDRPSLSLMLDQILASPLTARVLAEKPNTVIDLWYSTSTRPSIGNYLLRDFAVELVKCNNFAGGYIPNDKQAGSHANGSDRR